MKNIFTINIHESFMSRALELARQGLGKVSPNPMVGCVLVKNGEVIGEGFHMKYGGNHAEIEAINNASQDPVDSIAYVNLEPCCITGKTSACTDALISNGISEVYVSILDPNPKVNGKGLEKLINAGIKTHVGIMKDESQNLNRSFAKWITTGFPWVIAKVAQTKDGFMGIDSKTSIWLTNQESRKHTHTIRSKVDGVLIGSQTARIDNPSLTVREVYGSNPKRIILDTNRTLPYNLNVFQDHEAETIVLCSANRFNKSKTHNCKYIPVLEKNGRLSITSVLKTLAKEGITSLLIEGGQEVLKSCMDLELIDQLYIYTSNKILKNANLKNPVSLTDEWIVKEDYLLGDDKLIMAERGVECLQAL